MSRPKVVSLFSGAGGLDIGFEAAGFEVILSSDIMLEACVTLRKNFPNQLIFGPPEHSGDIHDLSGEVIRELTGISTGELDVMVGGPPCQPFSTAAAQRFLKGDKKFKRIGFDSEDKGQLIFRYVDLIMDLRPKCFLIENVPGILTIDKGTGISKVYEVLEEAGYAISVPTVVNAADYGVPQHRKRAFVIGTLSDHPFVFPNQSHTGTDSLFHENHIGCAAALADIPVDCWNHTTRDHAESSLKRYRSLIFGEREKLGRVDRLDPMKPSKTVIAGGTSGGGRSHLHPFLARTLTVRECARLQTYPDSYIFEGSMARQFTLVGNSVPPLIAEVLARAIGEQFFHLSYTDGLNLVLNNDTEAAANRLQKSCKEQNPNWQYGRDIVKPCG